MVYSGSIERVDFGEETDEKGFCIVTIKEEERERPGKGGLPLFAEEAASTPRERETTYRFVRTPARPFRTIRVALENDEEPTEAILREIANHDVKDTIVRVFYTAPEEMTEGVDLKTILEALKDAFLVASIVPQTKASERIRRAEVSEDLSLLDALDRYIQNNPDLEPMRDDLKLYAADLERELEEEIRP